MPTTTETTPTEATTATTQTTPEQAAPPTWETWLAEQTDDVKALAEGHITGLKSALDKERGDRKKFEKELRELAGKVEKGSEAEKELTRLAEAQAADERRADFYEAAHAQGVSNLKLAWIVAQQDELFDRKGNPDFATLKEKYPELFRAPTTPTPAGRAGAGTQNPTTPPSMNDLIRGAVGRR